MWVHSSQNRPPRVAVATLTGFNGALVRSRRSYSQIATGPGAGSEELKLPRDHTGVASLCTLPLTAKEWPHNRPKFVAKYYIFSISHPAGGVSPGSENPRREQRIMCGIAAMFSYQRPVDAEALGKGVKALHHRGPDGQHRWVAADGRVGLGHARLSIIDLATGDQPIANEDERLRIVVNGEFYGYESIQKELQGIGHRFRTQSDSEIALHLYEDLGVHCLHRLRGEFAFVLWDGRNRTIFAARDRFGIKPLFYAFHDQTLYLASEVKALFAMGVPARWNGDSLYHCLELGGYQSSTLFGGVFQVPPGYFLIANDSRIQLSKYWDFDYPLLSQDTGTRKRFRVRRGISLRPRRSGSNSAPCRRSGRLLSKRWDRFLCNS